MRRARFIAYGILLGLPVSVARAATVPDRQVFLDEFIPNVEAATNVRWSTWAKQNPEEQTAWTKFVNDVSAGTNPTVPTMSSRFGRALAAVGRMAVDEVTLPPLPPIIYPSPLTFPTEVL